MNVKFHFVWILAIPACTSFASEPACRIDHLSEVRIGRVKEDFSKNFCTPRQDCPARWKNFSGLLSRTLNDSEVSNVGTAAYILATAVGETAQINFAPGHEVKGGLDKDYMKPIGGKVYDGRGWVQLTGFDRYKKIGQKLGLDLLHNADLAMQPDVAYTILSKGMIKGWFESYRTDAEGGVTGHEIPIIISDFITDNEVDYVRARAVINANCKKVGGEHNRCAMPDTPFRKGLYIPKVSELNRAMEIGGYAKRLEMMLCDAARSN